jgi:hypothetical protein
MSSPTVTYRRPRHTRAGIELPRTDGRTVAARRFRDLVCAYEQEVGGEVSAVESDLIRQAAVATLRCEQLQAAVIRGEPIDDGELTRLLGAARRLLAILYSKADRKKSAGPTPLQAYIARREAAQPDDIHGAAEGEDYGEE